MELQKQLIGVHASMFWHSEPSKILERYFSFGQYDQENDRDTFGVHDHNIFFYAHEGEKQIKKMMEKEPNGFEFTVMSYFPVYSYEGN